KLESSSTRVAYLEQRNIASCLTFSECEQLMEPDLLEGPRYLTQCAEATVVAGAQGAGQEFTSWCTHLLEGRPAGRFGTYEASLGNEAIDNRVLFGQVAGQDDADGTAMFEQCRGGSIHVRSCEQLGDEFLLKLCDAALSHDV